MTDQMDVDVTTISPTSSFEKLDLANLNLDELNKEMQRRCHTMMWQVIMEQAEGNPSRWQSLISAVFGNLTAVLVTTKAKNSFITSTLGAIEGIVTDFNEAELKHWKAGVRKGVETSDWISLITHSMYISDYRMVGLC